MILFFWCVVEFFKFVFCQNLFPPTELPADAAGNIWRFSPSQELRNTLTTINMLPLTRNRVPPPPKRVFQQPNGSTTETEPLKAQRSLKDREEGSAKPISGVGCSPSCSAFLQSTSRSRITLVYSTVRPKHHFHFRCLLAAKRLGFVQSS